MEAHRKETKLFCRSWKDYWKKETFKLGPEGSVEVSRSSSVNN